MQIFTTASNAKYTLVSNARWETFYIGTSAPLTRACGKHNQ